MEREVEYLTCLLNEVERVREREEGERERERERES